MVIALLCNDTATTELYTYRHSLSLHDARPICWALNAKVYALDALGRHDEAADIFDRIVEQPYDPAQSGWMVNFAINRGSRGSEEQTSELQSLMRLSSAVFCLQKQTALHDALNGCAVTDM